MQTFYLSSWWSYTNSSYSESLTPPLSVLPVKLARTWRCYWGTASKTTDFFKWQWSVQTELLSMFTGETNGKYFIFLFSLLIILFQIRKRETDSVIKQ